MTIESVSAVYSLTSVKVPKGRSKKEQVSEEEVADAIRMVAYSAPELCIVTLPQTGSLVFLIELSNMNGYTCVET